MTDQQESKNRAAVVKRFLRLFTVAAVLFLAGLYLLVNPILNSPFVADRISRLLTDTLHRPTTFTAIRLAGGTFDIEGLKVANPQGFAPGSLLSVRSLQVAPAWWKLLGGGRAFSALRVRGLRLSLATDGKGRWNFSGMFVRKGGGGEISVKSLTVEDSSVFVNGRGVEDISLSLHDLSTKGRTGTPLLLAFRDEYGSPYRLEGKGRLGDRPEFDIKFSAPSFTFRPLKGLRLPIDCGRGGGRIDMDAGLHDGVVRVRCAAEVARLTLKAKEWQSPLNGTLSLAGRYDLKSDEANLESCLVRVEKALRLQASGRVAGVRKERRFSLAISSERIDLKEILNLLPGKLRDGLQAEGELLPSTFAIKGSAAQGVTSARGGAALAGVSLSRGERLILKSVRADARILGGKGGWEVEGRVSQGDTDALPLFRPTDIPFSLTLDERLRPSAGEVHAFTASFAGVPVKGGVSYRVADAQPLAARIELAEGSLPRLLRSFPVKGVDLTDGTVRGGFRARGNLSGNVQCDLAATITALKGRYAGGKITLETASLQASGGKRGAAISASGRFNADGVEIMGKRISASIPWRLEGERLTLSGVDGTMDKTSFGISEFAGTLPAAGAFAAARAIPIDCRFSGLRVLREGSGLEGASGEVRGNLAARGGNRRLEGKGALTAPVVMFRGKKAGSLAVSLKSTAAGTSAAVSGRIMDGSLSASVQGDPFAPGSGAVFSAEIRAMSASGLSDLMGKGAPVKATGGRLHLSARGDYGSGKGVLVRGAISGSDLALAGSNGRTILNGGSLDLSGEWVNGDLLVKEGTAAVGGVREVSLQGRLDSALAAERKGAFTLAVPMFPIPALLDAFANVLPRPLQEADAAGRISLDARIGIDGKRAIVGGKLIVEEGGMDVPSQKLSISGINGALPFAFEHGGKGPQAPPKSGFSRENYTRLLSLLEGAAKGEHNLTIGRIRFGTTEFDETRLLITAAKGMTEMKSVGSGLFNGELLGRGFFSMDGGARYGADILVHDLSLRQLCNTYPAINGYISGRVDGLISLVGMGKGLEGLKGFVEFWSRSASDEKMLVSKEFLQKISGKKLQGIFFQNDRPFDRGEITAYLDGGYLTFKTLDISHTNFFGMRDLSVTVAPVQNKIALDHLLASIREAASRGKGAKGGGGEVEPPPATEFKWED